MKTLKEIPFNHELIGQEGIVIKNRKGKDYECFVSKNSISAKKTYPIFSFDKNGLISQHTIKGKFDTSPNANELDLIMYQEVEVREPRVIWVNYFDKAIFGIYSTKKGADDFSVKGEGYETVKFIEVIEEGE